MEPDFQIYNGVEMDASKVRALEDAQAFVAYVKDGVEYPRIRYGDESEDWGAGSGRLCSSCGARKGQFHADGCEVERCPICGDDALDCEHYWYNEDDFNPTVGEVEW